MKPPSPRAVLRRWVAWTGVLLFCGLLAAALWGWMQLRGGPAALVGAAEPAGPAAVGQAPAAGGTARAALPAPGHQAHHAPATAGTAPLPAPAQEAWPPHSAARAASAAAGWRFETVHACGYGPVELHTPPDGSDAWMREQLPAALGAPARAAVWPLLLAAMAQSPQPRVQAAGWALRASGAAEKDLGGTAPTLRGAALERATEALVRLATAGSDWGLWSLARGVCAYSRAELPQACAAVHAEAAVRQMPQQALAWLALAGEREGDAAAQTEALARAAAAPEVGAAWALLPAAVLAAWPTGWPEHLQQQFLVIALTVEQLFADSSWMLALRACPGQAPAPDGRVQVCSALVQHLQARADSLQALLITSLAAERLGMDAERRAMRSEVDRLLQALTEHEARHPVLSCASARSNREWVQQVQRVGERAAAAALADAPR